MLFLAGMSVWSLGQIWVMWTGTWCFASTLLPHGRRLCHKEVMYCAPQEHSSDSVPCHPALITFSPLMGVEEIWSEPYWFSFPNNQPMGRQLLGDMEWSAEPVEKWSLVIWDSNNFSKRLRSLAAWLNLFEKQTKKPLWLLNGFSGFCVP